MRHPRGKYPSGAAPPLCGGVRPAGPGWCNPGGCTKDFFTHDYVKKMYKRFSLHMTMCKEKCTNALLYK